MKRIALINRKGGVGKSSTVFHLAGELAMMGYKVLACDVDVQGDTTNNFLAEEESEYDVRTSKTILDFINGNAKLDEVVKKNYIKVGNKKPSYFGIDVLPFDVRLDKQELVKELTKGIDIKSLFDSLEYDFVLIDCPPSNKAVEGIVLEQIATHVVIPMSNDINTIRGYKSLLNKIEKARKHNEELKIVGMFFSMFFKQRRKCRERREIMRKHFPELFIDIAIPNSSAVVDSIEDYGQPICYHKKSIAKEPYSMLTDEILKRL